MKNKRIILFVLPAAVIAAIMIVYNVGSRHPAEALHTLCGT